MAWPVVGDKEMMTSVASDAFLEFVDPTDRPWECVIVRAVFSPGDRLSDPALRYYDSRFEGTWYPTDLLWGPGTITDAARWFAENRPEPDECDYLDQVFMIRHDGTNLYLPMRPSVVAALSEVERPGTWYTVRADRPGDAYSHVRRIVTGERCDRTGPCVSCHAENLGSGPYDEALLHARQSVSSAPPLPNDARTPFAHPRCRQMTA